MCPRDGSGVVWGNEGTVGARQRWHGVLVTPLSPSPIVPKAFPTLVGDMDNSGSLNAQILHLLAERIRTKAVFQVGLGFFWGGGGGDNGAGVSPSPIGSYPPNPIQTHQAKFVTWQFDGEYRGDDCTATLTLGNPDLLGGSGKWGVPPSSVSPPTLKSPCGAIEGTGR